MGLPGEMVIPLVTAPGAPVSVDTVGTVERRLMAEKCFLAAFRAMIHLVIVDVGDLDGFITSNVL